MCAAVRHRQLPALAPGDALVAACLQAKVAVGAPVLSLRVEDLQPPGAVVSDEDVAVRIGGEGEIMSITLGSAL